MRSPHRGGRQRGERRHVAGTRRDGRRHRRPSFGCLHRRHAHARTRRLGPARRQRPSLGRTPAGGRTRPLVRRRPAPQRCVPARRPRRHDPDFAQHHRASLTTRAGDARGTPRHSSPGRGPRTGRQCVAARDAAPAHCGAFPLRDAPSLASRGDTARARRTRTCPRPGPHLRRRHPSACASLTPDPAHLLLHDQQGKWP